MKLSRYRITVTGIVQGVGFRPFIFNLARSFGLKGWVSNSGACVIIEAEGTIRQLDAFVQHISADAPPLSNIREVKIEVLAACGFNTFEILESTSGSKENIFISPDVSICQDCQNELMDKSDRRFLYPFINCTNCGPRFTIITDVPYDRKNTTMNKFAMCDRCASEYTDPSNRRYHAQPVSCHSCGPVLRLVDRYGSTVNTSDPVESVKKLISQGFIIAIKGLGGYHLACDATNDSTVALLRKRKHRDDKPFAVMVKDSAVAAHLCHVSPFERQLLESPARPIVLLRKKESSVSPHVAPGNPTLGVMLPYTPVHVLLFNNYEDNTCKMASDFTRHPAVLVMTSGNISCEPIFYRDEEALEGLKDIADYFLMNDRDIYIRTDDSVTRVFRDREYIIRRSRGYVPRPVSCDVLKGLSAGVINTAPSAEEAGSKPQHAQAAGNPSGVTIAPVLACGGELKNTFCINKGTDFYLSHHIGDLENAETLQSFEEGIEHFKKILYIEPRAAAYDLHPSYLSTAYAQSLDVPHKIAVQHHHAHIASCMAENNLDGEVIGIAFDGTGYGEDGNIWGGEFFTGSYEHFKRVGHLEYIKMPGGDAAVRQPWRMALSCLYNIYGKSLYNSLLECGSAACASGYSYAKCMSSCGGADGWHSGSSLSCSRGIILNGMLLFGDIEADKIRGVLQMLEKNINSPLTSSMGRLFDAVSALIGIREEITFEGQAAMELEFSAAGSHPGRYAFRLDEQGEIFIINTGSIIKGILDDVYQGVSKSAISDKFHETVSAIILESCCLLRQNCGLDRVVLSGGVFQNMLLLERSVEKLEKEGFKVYTHSKVPSNDGGIALGQAVIAAAKLRKINAGSHLLNNT